ncbi:hypothetical protein Taro_030932, partial [Colocasia esculenta]|nr:hypothetical protein [Colocasia esculenta]
LPPLWLSCLLPEQPQKPSCSFFLSRRAADAIGGRRRRHCFACHRHRRKPPPPPHLPVRAACVYAASLAQPPPAPALPVLPREPTSEEEEGRRRSCASSLLAGHYVLEFCYRYLLRAWHDLAKARHSASAVDGTDDVNTSSTGPRVSLYTCVSRLPVGDIRDVSITTIFRFINLDGDSDSLLSSARDALGFVPVGATRKLSFDHSSLDFRPFPDYSPSGQPVATGLTFRAGRSRWGHVRVTTGSTDRAARSQRPALSRSVRDGTLYRDAPVNAAYRAVAFTRVKNLKNSGKT